MVFPTNYTTSSRSKGEGIVSRMKGWFGRNVHVTGIDPNRVIVHGRRVLDVVRQSLDVVRPSNNQVQVLSKQHVANLIPKSQIPEENFTPEENFAHFMRRIIDLYTIPTHEPLTSEENKMYAEFAKNSQSLLEGRGTHHAIFNQFIKGAFALYLGGGEAISTSRGHSVLIEILNLLTPEQKEYFQTFVEQPALLATLINHGEINLNILKLIINKMDYAQRSIFLKGIKDQMDVVKLVFSETFKVDDKTGEFFGQIFDQPAETEKKKQELKGAQELIQQSARWPELVGTKAIFSIDKMGPRLHSVGMIRAFAVAMDQHAKEVCAQQRVNQTLNEYRKDCVQCKKDPKEFAKMHINNWIGLENEYLRKNQKMPELVTRARNMIYQELANRIRGFWGIVKAEYNKAPQLETPAGLQASGRKSILPGLF